MNWKTRLFSNMFFRNMLADLGKRSGYPEKSREYIPYFLYKVGQYKTDFHLYFPAEPFAIRYKNEIFNKLNEYSGYDVIKFLEFHYSAYPDKGDFLRFLHFEIADRINRFKIRKSFRLKLELSLKWTLDKKQDLKEIQEEGMRQEIENGVKKIIQNHSVNSPHQIDYQITMLADKLNLHIGNVMTETEKAIRELTGSFSTGTIQINNHNHEEKIIQLLILIQQIQAPPQQSRAEQLFKKFNASDIASILHLHFDAFNDNKLNTIQRKVGEQFERIKPNNARVKKLTDALQEFFYL